MMASFDLSGFRLEDMEQLLNQFEALGPLPGLLAAWLESLLPFLPLVAILIANVNIYGFLEGFLLSWIGVVSGAFTVFWIIRRFGGRIRHFVERKSPRSKRLIEWLERHGFMPIFLLSCFPFTPSFLVNIVSGISKVPFHTFIIATLLGKGIMILIVSFAGHDLFNLFQQPWKLVLIVSLFGIMALTGRKIESKYFK
ncbi:TVP38/TMEM64 family protein [Paenibacillus ginsengarvi]|uniref:TVP38/TMEM64 family membrane protein n=1 Tax=Paenibacillus ginsengarvi TaxID=400777 RepID=A0A3B0CNW1_9BACL|nr:TVP38/TMEM64 family protein [Paenibacillus ginsengarvi]RKN85899.1 TVP38/TMEM64 family protein [Paenibacillus ginsengarvi]